MTAVFRHCFRWYTSIERHPVNKSGAIIPDDSVNIAGYYFKVTFLLHRKAQT